MNNLYSRDFPKINKILWHILRVLRKYSYPVLGALRNKLLQRYWLNNVQKVKVKVNFTLEQTNINREPM